MKIVINQQNLVNIISIAQKAVSSRTTMQILTGILFEAKNGFLHLSSTDFDISIKTKTPCTIEEEGSIVINSNLFGSIARKLPNAEVSISTDKNNIKISCDKIEYDIIGMDKNEFPSLPDVSSDESLKIEEDIFVKSIKSTLFSASLDDTRAVFMGVLLETDNDNINFVSLDGYRLSRVRIKNNNSFDISSVIPARSLSELIKIVAPGESVNISTSGGNMMFEFGDTKFYTRLLEGRFVDYKAMLQEKYESFFTTSKSDLTSALERISILATEDKARLIKIHVEEKQMILRSNTEIGNGYETVEIDRVGEDLKIAFNNRYLLEGIRAMDCKEVKVNYKGTINPITIQPIDDEFDYTYLVLPVKLKSEAL